MELPLRSMAVVVVVVVVASVTVATAAVRLPAVASFVNLLEAIPTTTDNNTFHVLYIIEIHINTESTVHFTARKREEAESGTSI